MKFNDLLEKFNKLEETTSQKTCKNCGVYQKTLKEGLCEKCMPKEVKEVAPPGFDPKLKKKLLTQYSDQPAKAYAEMWSIHNKNLKESYDEDEEYKPCISCRKKSFIDFETGMCMDCIGEVLSGYHKQGMHAEQDDERCPLCESSPQKKCMSCGEQILGQGKKTTKGDTICNNCDRYYAFGGPGELDEAEMCEMCNEDPCTCDYTNNIEPQMKLLPELAKQPINAAITATMDTATGKKQVTVTADGESADELLKMLTNAGLNPQMIQPTIPVDEDLANSPNAKYTSSDVQLNKMSGGPNKNKVQISKDRARDNAMTISADEISELAESFRKQFVHESKKK